MSESRLGLTFKATITGDNKEVSLPTASHSGLIYAVVILEGVNGLAFVHVDESDVVRHHLVQRISRAYDEHKARLAEQQLSLLEPKPSAPQPAPLPVPPEEPRLRN